MESNKIEKMTNEELREVAKKYDLMQNEGGEGYNPYNVELDNREREAWENRPRTLADKKREIYHELERKDSTIARESGTYNQAEIDALRNELEEIEKQEEREFAIEWTIEITKTRRENWNNFIKSLVTIMPVTAPRKKMTAENQRLINCRINEQCWSINDLKKAVRIHNL